jgi:hypothetical protein
MAADPDSDMWQAPSGHWYSIETPPYVPPQGVLPDGCPGIEFWQAPDGNWFPLDTPPYRPEPKSGAPAVADRQSGRFGKRGRSAEQTGPETDTATATLATSGPSVQTVPAKEQAKRERLGRAKAEERAANRESMGRAKAEERAKRESLARAKSADLARSSERTRALNNACSRLKVSIDTWEQNVETARRKLSLAIKEQTKRVQVAQKAVDDSKTIKRMPQSNRSIQLFEDSIIAMGRRHPLNPNVTAAIDTAGNLSHTRRHTLTRFALFGAFSVFAPKNTKHDDRELFILLEAPDWAEVVKVNADSQMAARKLVQAINLTARHVNQQKVVRAKLISDLAENFHRVAADRLNIDSSEKALVTAFSTKDSIRDADESLQGLIEERDEAEVRYNKKAQRLLVEAEGILSAELDLDAERAIDTSVTNATESTARFQYLAQLHGMLSELRDAKERSSDQTFASVSGLDQPEPVPVMVSEAELDQPRQSMGRQVPVSEGKYVIEQIKLLGELRDADLITTEQFEAKRQEFLDRL